MAEIVVRAEALKALRVTLTTVTRGVLDIRRQITRDAQGVQSEIAAAVAIRTAEVYRCERALALCQSRPNANCAKETQFLEAAKRRLQHALEARDVASGAISDFEARSTATVNRVNSINQLGQNFLLRKLSKVAEVRVGTGSLAAHNSVSRRSSGASSPGSADEAFAVVGMQPGWMMVPISLIDQAEDPISGPEDFGKGYSVEDLDYAFELLETSVLPALAQGATADDFQARDLLLKQWGTRSLSMTYSQFLTNRGDSIRLDAGKDGRFRIENGRHRIWVASVTGRTHVPAFIVSG